MNPNAVQAALQALRESEVSVVCFLIDSLLKELYPVLVEAEDIRTIPALRSKIAAHWKRNLIFFLLCV